MGNYVTVIDLDTYNKEYLNCLEVSSLSTDEDIATFIDTFEYSNILGYNILKVLELDGKYIFVVSNENTGYDLIEEINKLSILNIRVSSQNAKLLFDKSKSRGYSKGIKVSSEEVSTGDLDNDSDETATSFINEEDLPNIKRVLYHKLKGIKIPINDSHGVIIGRSSSQSEYTVANSKVSRKHARVYKEGNKYMVHDFDSANGTYVDGLRVHSDLDRELIPGGILILGNEEFVLK